MRTLSRATLDQLPDGVPIPTYLTEPVRVGIVHLGVGNFQRSHQAMYLDRLLTTDPDAPWALCGVGVRDEDRPLLEAMAAQDGLYSLSLFHPDGAVDTRVVGALRELVLVPDDPAAAVARLADPAVRIVSLTITESGYVEDPANGRHAADDPGVLADVAGDLAEPRTAFGLLVAALRARRAADVAPFTVLSCDNIQRNGAVARASVIATARLASAELAAWIEEHVGFPSTMVDRITPRPTTEQLSIVQAALGVRDDAAVVAEPFEQWVLEDDFRTGRPALERVGAVFVDDIDSYESMKLRLLNGAHQVIAYLGLLAGHRFVHEAVADPRVRSWVDAYSYELALPTVAPPDGVDGEAYLAVLAERFTNPAIADTLERIATDSEDRLAKFVLPVLLDARGTEAFRRVAPAVLGAWASTLATTRSPVIAGSVSDEALAAVRSEEDPAGFLSTLEWLGPLADDGRLRDDCAAVVRALRGADPATALDALDRALR